MEIMLNIFFCQTFDINCRSKRESKENENDSPHHRYFYKNSNKGNVPNKAREDTLHKEMKVRK